MTGEPAELSLSGIARHWAVRDPERRALAEGDLALTYGHWTELGDLVAQGLRRAGVAPGDRVLFLGRNGLVYPVLALGVSRNRGVIVGVNFRLGAREIAAIVADCEPSLVFVEREFLQIYELASELARLSVDTISYDGHSDLRSLEQWWAEAPDVEMPRTEPGDIAALVYTSGTTGEPKGVVIRNRQMVAAARGVSRAGSLDRAVFLVALPMFHISGLCWMYTTCFGGGTVVPLADATPRHLQAAIAYYQITDTMLVPVLIQSLMDLPLADPRAYRSLR